MKNSYGNVKRGCCLFSRWLVILFATSQLGSCMLAESDQSRNYTDSVTGKGARFPRLISLPDNSLLMSWLEPVGENYALKFANIKNGHVIKKNEVARGANWFVNWSDFPSVVPITGEFWLSHRLVKQAGGKTYDYDVVLSISNDAGMTWRDIGSPHRDGLAAEHGFAVIVPEKDTAGIVWLDGREYFDKKDIANNPNKSGNFNLRYTRIHKDGSAEAEQVIDDNTCTCCSPSVAVTAVGPVAAWRGRTDSEIRDNRVSILRDGKWSVPAPLGNEGWEIAGCPVNGPAMAARGNQVVAAWFTAQGERPRVRAAFSSDGGQTFGKPIEIDDIAPLGRIGLVWRDDHSAIVSWMMQANSANKKTDIALRVIHTDGSADNIKPVVKVSAGRDAGVPQLAMLPDGKVMLAWTESAPDYGIKTLVADINKLKADVPMQTYLMQQPLPFVAYICSRKH